MCQRRKTTHSLKVNTRLYQKRRKKGRQIKRDRHLANDERHHIVRDIDRHARRPDPAVSLTRRRRLDGAATREQQTQKRKEGPEKRWCHFVERRALETTTAAVEETSARSREEGREPPPPPSRIGRGDRVVDEFDRGQDVSIDDAFISDTRFVRNQHERKEKEKTEQATNLRRSASLFYVVSSILFVVRRFVTPNNADGNEFLVVFDTVYTFVCLAFSRIMFKRRNGCRGRRRCCSATTQ